MFGQEVVNKLEKLSYPNPQAVRRKWIELNGSWNFCFDDADCGRRGHRYRDLDFYDQEIQVPYSYSCKASGIHSSELHPIVWYHRTLEMKPEEGKRYLLHFEAVDYEMELYVNGSFAGSHQGGHTAFFFDISDFLQDENEIAVRVCDYSRTRQPIGKQSWKASSFDVWYTRTIGIWQSVWMEEVGRIYLSDFRITPNIDDASIEIDAFVVGTVGQLGTPNNLDLGTNVSSARLLGQISYQGRLISSFSLGIKSDRARGRIDISDESPDFRLRYWSPDSPHLYDIRLQIETEDGIEDEVESYFGMRSIDCHKGRIYLNHQEFYQKLVLDQGYFREGGMTASAAALEKDVRQMKEMGFNGARKHQKIESHRYLYLMDCLGLVLWAEMPSFYEYSHLSNANASHELYGLIAKHYNHPSVIVYTLMNESWGVNEVYSNPKEQSFVDALYHLTKSLDDTRLVIGNDGWEQCKTDILSYHDYNGDARSLLEHYRNLDCVVNASPSVTSHRHTYAKGYSHQGEPFILSEFGGIAFDCDSEEGIKTWGYGERMENRDAVFAKIKDLLASALAIPACSGICYTQLSDVEQEVNGLLDHAHNYKFDPAQIRAILDSADGFVFD